MLDPGKIKKAAVIMAGGMGERLWPRSTERKPKQFVHLLGEGTMIQNTVVRLMPFFQPEDIYIVASKQMYDLVIDQLPLIPSENIILEPFGRNTAPCVALAARIIEQKYEPDTVMMAFPSDHVISNVREFHQSLETAAVTAYERNGIVAIGITPTRPETAFGYVQIKEKPGDLGELYDKGVRYSSAFAEKPDKATAKRFVDSGDFLWNGGIFVWRLDTFWQAFEKFLPEHDLLFNMLKKHIGKTDFDIVVEDIYRQMQSQSVDYAIMEKADNVYVVESSFSWSDLGNWDELYRLSKKDGRNNVIEGDVIAVNTSNCLVSSNGTIIGIAGVEDLIVINSKEALLICKRGNSEEVKEIVDFMKRKQINKFL